jgi:hypothetical protein
MNTHLSRWAALLGGLLLLAGLSGTSRADTRSDAPAETSAGERIEVAALTIMHRDFRRPTRLLARAGQMPTLEFDGRAFGLRVLAFDPHSATIEVVELERLQAMESGKRPHYRETRTVERLLMQPGQVLHASALDAEISYRIDEMARARSAKDCRENPAMSKGENDNFCCLSCGELTVCSGCVLGYCGTCCA